ncbi:MAG: ribonuclease P protein component [Rikenellaceae bacterium]
MEQRHTFTKSERLCSQKTISELFEKGSSGFIFPFRYVYTVGEVGDYPNLRLLISVSKRYHKRANKRNLNKRRIREAFRLNNHPLKLELNAKAKSINLALIYSSKECLEYKTVENAVKKILANISESF